MPSNPDLLHIEPYTGADPTKWEIADIGFILEVYLLSAKSGERPNFNRLPELVDPNTYV